MIAVDTNILVYSHRQDMPFHDAAYELVKEKSEGRAPWALPWPCIHEFLAIVTNPRVFKRPTPLGMALEQLREWLRSPSIQTLAEDAGYFDVLATVLSNSSVEGPKVHDARIAAICMYHGVSELWSADRDFSRFVGLTTHNPLVS